MSDLIDLKIKELELSAEAADKLAAKYQATNLDQAKKNLEQWLEVFEAVYDRMEKAVKR